MAINPKITGDAQVDSWALQVTQELNVTRDENTRLLSIIRRAAQAADFAAARIILQEI